MKQYYVYILASQHNGTLYIEETSNIIKNGMIYMKKLFYNF
ncbi:hypothetical protein A1I_06550 [Rickettsia bellii OSU 85-389]|nr:hypothetical protein A1I_06550 [Rickettsia bellii OSU 85-389]